MIIEPSGEKSSYKLVYSGYSGISEREISLLSPLDTEEDQYISAYCFKKKSKRTFKTNSVVSLINISTGEILTNRDFKFQFKPIVRIVKKTVSKSGNLYYYEKCGIINKEFKPSWEKIGEQRFRRCLSEYFIHAVKIDYENNEIIYLEWHENQNKHVNEENEVKLNSIEYLDTKSNNLTEIKFDNKLKGKKGGCALLLLAFIFIALFTVLLM